MVNCFFQRTHSSCFDTFNSTPWLPSTFSSSFSSQENTSHQKRRREEKDKNNKFLKETFQTGCLSQKEDNRHGTHEKTNQRAGEQLLPIFMLSLMAFSCNGLYSNRVMFCFYKHNVAFVPRHKGIDELKETWLHDQCYFQCKTPAVSYYML